MRGAYGRRSGRSSFVKELREKRKRMSNKLAIQNTTPYRVAVAAYNGDATISVQYRPIVAWAPFGDDGLEPYIMDANPLFPRARPARILTRYQVVETDLSEAEAQVIAFNNAVESVYDHIEGKSSIELGEMLHLPLTLVDQALQLLLRHARIVRTGTDQYAAKDADS